MFAFGYVNYNRFLVIDLREYDRIRPEALCALSTKLCTEAFIDDVIVLERSSMADARMRIFGADGREADFCGNGALLTLHLLFNEQHSTGDLRDTLHLETALGTKRGVREKSGRVSVEVGNVVNLDAMIDDLRVSRINNLGVNFEGFRVSGEPHVVVSAPPGSAVINQSRQEFDAMARSIAQFVEFDGGVNVTLVLHQDDKGLRIRTYERGVQRMTESCGSGAVAAVSACTDGIECGRVTVTSPGGQHHIWTDSGVPQWWLSAPATHLRRDEIPDLSGWLMACLRDHAAVIALKVPGHPDVAKRHDQEAHRFPGSVKSDSASPRVKQNQLGGPE